MRKRTLRLTAVPVAAVVCGKLFESPPVAAQDGREGSSKRPVVKTPLDGLDNNLVAHQFEDRNRLLSGHGGKILEELSIERVRRGDPANLLAGRARTLAMHPLTAAELGGRCDLTHSVRYGQLPSVYVERDPKQ